MCARTIIFELTSCIVAVTATAHHNFNSADSVAPFCIIISLSFSTIRVFLYYCVRGKFLIYDQCRARSYARSHFIFFLYFVVWFHTQIMEIVSDIFLNVPYRMRPLLIATVAGALNNRARLAYTKCHSIY